MRTVLENWKGYKLFGSGNELVKESDVNKVCITSLECYSYLGDYKLSFLRSNKMKAFQSVILVTLRLRKKFQWKVSKKWFKKKVLLYNIVKTDGCAFFFANSALSLRVRQIINNNIQQDVS